MRQRKFTFGDRIQARLVLEGKIVAELVSDTLADMTQLLNALRFRTRELRGLASLYVRNLTRGWAEERPLMLYSSLCVPGGGTAIGTRAGEVGRELFGYGVQDRAVDALADSYL